MDPIGPNRKYIAILGRNPKAYADDRLLSLHEPPTLPSWIIYDGVFPGRHAWRADRLYDIHGRWKGRHPPTCKLPEETPDLSWDLAECSAKIDIRACGFGLWNDPISISHQLSLENACMFVKFTLTMYSNWRTKWVPSLTYLHLLVCLWRDKGRNFGPIVLIYNHYLCNHFWNIRWQSGLRNVGSSMEIINNVDSVPYIIIDAITLCFLPLFIFTLLTLWCG